MNIKFYRTLEDNDHINKTLTNEISITGSLRAACDVLNPVIEVEHNAAIFTNHINYAYIPDFGRYYHITGLRVDGKVDVIQMHVDVLKTYASDILGSNGTIVRSQSGDRFIKDPRATQTERISWSSQDLGAAFTAGSAYILIKGVTG